MKYLVRYPRQRTGFGYRCCRRYRWWGCGFVLNTFIVVGLLAFWSGTATARPQGAFVTTDGTRLMLNGGAFYFSGANSYSMLYSKVEAKEQYEIAQSLGVNAIRMWGFWNGKTTGTRQALQPAPGQYPEQAWQRFDYAVYLAHQYNIKLIVPLMNEWTDFGGIETYMDWIGIETPVKPPFADRKAHYYRYENAVKNIRGDFWTNKDARQLYFNYVAQVLNRVNTYTGVKYKDDPAIMIWEVINEPRFGPWGVDNDATKIRDWIAAAAAHIKSIDRNHLVGTGEEGFLRRGDSTVDVDTYPWIAASGEGVDYVLNAQIKDIDVLGFHCWPFQWGLWGTSLDDSGQDQLGHYPDISEFGPVWIKEHVRLANKFNKPSYLGEFGFQILRRKGSDVADRDLIMKKVYEYAKTTNLAGVAFWHLTAAHDSKSAIYQGPIARKTLSQAQFYDDIVPHDIDFRFEIYCPEDKTTCALIKDYSDFVAPRIANPVSACGQPHAGLNSPRHGRCPNDVVSIAWQPVYCGVCANVCDAAQPCQWESWRTDTIAIEADTRQ